MDGTVPASSNSRTSRVPPAGRIAILLGVFVVVGVLLWALQGGVSFRSDAPRIGASAPNFTASDLNGQSIGLAGARGRPVILNFWATWCGPCKAEMPAITAVAKDNPNVVVLAVNVLEGPVLVQEFVRTYSLGFTPLLDPAGTVAGQYKVNSLPSSFFISSDGTIRAINVGPMDQPTIEQNLRRAST